MSISPRTSLLLTMTRCRSASSVVLPGACRRWSLIVGHMHSTAIRPALRAESRCAGMRRLMFVMFLLRRSHTTFLHPEVIHLHVPYWVIGQWIPAFTRNLDCQSISLHAQI